MDFCDGCGDIKEGRQLCPNCDLSGAVEKTTLCTTDDTNNEVEKQDVAQEIKDQWERCLHKKSSSLL